MQHRRDFPFLDCAAGLTAPAGFLLSWLTLRQEMPACVVVQSGQCVPSGLGRIAIASCILAVSLLGAGLVIWQGYLKRRNAGSASRQIGHGFGQIAAGGTVFLANLMLARLGGVFSDAVSLRTLVLFDGAMLLTLGAFAGRIPPGRMMGFLDKRPIVGRLAHDRSKLLGGRLLAATGLAAALAAGFSAMLAVSVMSLRNCGDALPFP